MLWGSCSATLAPRGGPLRGAHRTPGATFCPRNAKARGSPLFLKIKDTMLAQRDSVLPPGLFLGMGTSDSLSKAL